MKEILEYLSANWMPLLVLIVALGVLAVIVATIVVKKDREKRDEEYAKMLCDVPIENAEADGAEKVEVRKERGNSEMDWLKGKIGKSGVLAANDIPEAVKAEIALKEQKEKEEREAEEAARKAAEEADAARGDSAESEFEAISPNKKPSKTKAKKAAKSKNPKKNEESATEIEVEKPAEIEVEEPKKVAKKEKTEKKAEAETVVTATETAEAEKAEKANAGEKAASAEVKPEETAEEIATAAEEKTSENDTAEEEAEDPVVATEEKPEEIESATTEETGETETKEEELTSENDEKVGETEAEQLNLFTEDYMANDEKATKKVAGKWMVKEKGEGEYVAFLYANNKEVLLTSETYSTVDGAKKGVATIQKNATDENFAVYKDKNKHFYFKLKNSKNRFLCVGETYPNRNACLNSIESVKKFVDSPISDAVEKDITLIKYVPTPEDKLPQKKYSGKWIIKEEDGEYTAELHASNGELLLSSESYASYASAKDAIENISQNGIAGNFIVDSDKKGRYFFKLRNATKVTLCVGETYSQLQACLSAIDSVRSFLKTAKLADNQ